MTACFAFEARTHALFGDGQSLQLGKVAAERGWRRPGVVVDAAISALPAVQETIATLTEVGLTDVELLEVTVDHEPNYEYLDDCAKSFRTLSRDSVIGIGGGSAMDLAKALAILTTNPGRGIDYRGVDLIRVAGLPTALLPTTAGTGSEATATAVFIDAASGVKLGINGRHMTPAVGIMDPLLTAGCPRPVAIASGLDAIVHSLEAFMTCRDHPFAHALSVRALALIFDSFSEAIETPNAHDARLGMLTAANMAGITLHYSRGGVLGALSYPLGTQFSIPHGLAGGVLLSHLVRANIAAGYRGYEPLAPYLPGPAAGFAIKLDQMLDSLGAPRDFTAFPVRRKNIDQLVATTRAQRSAALDANPVPADDEMLRGLLEAAIPE